MNSRTLLGIGMALVAVIAASVLSIRHVAVAIGPDVDNDGKVTIADILAVVHAYGQYVPTPTATPTVTATPTETLIPTNTSTATFTPTATPTPSPELQTGGGHERVLAQNLVLPPGRTEVASIDSSLCTGAIFYWAARTTDPARSTYITVYVNGNVQGGGQFQVDPTWQDILVHNFNIGGTSVLRSQLNWGGVNPAVIAVEVNESLGIAVEVSLDMHCEPAHE